MKYDDLKIGTQIVFTAFGDTPLHAVCIHKADDKADFLAEHGSLLITEKDFDEIVKNFKVEIINESHVKWQEVDTTFINFFSKIDELEKRSENGEDIDEMSEIMKIMGELGIDKNRFDIDEDE